MTAQDALKNTLRDVVGPNARSHGYTGSAPTWRKSNPSGDWAVVNVQSSSASTSERLRCVINLAVAPDPWLRWERELLGSAMPKAVTESLGLYRQRLHPTGTPEGTDGWWEIGDDDTDSALAAATDMVGRLEHHGWPRLEHMLMPGGMLEQIRHGHLGHMKLPNYGVLFARAEALLVMDQGPSHALDERLKDAREDLRPEQRENAERFEEWVRTQAQTTR